MRTCWCAAGENYEDDTLGCMEPLVATPLPVGDEFTYLLFTKPLAWETAELVRTSACLLCACSRRCKPS